MTEQKSKKWLYNFAKFLLTRGCDIVEEPQLLKWYQDLYPSWELIPSFRGDYFCYENCQSERELEEFLFVLSKKLEDEDEEPEILSLTIFYYIAVVFGLSNCIDMLECWELGLFVSCHSIAGKILLDKPQRQNIGKILGLAPQDNLTREFNTFEFLFDHKMCLDLEKKNQLFKVLELIAMF